MTNLFEDRQTRANFFDQFDNEAAPALEQSAGWEPTLRERFEQNWEDAKRHSPLGVIQEGVDARVGSDEADTRTRAQQDQAALDYQQMTPSDSLLDYVAATGGQLTSAAMDPTSYIYAPLKIAGALGRVMGPTAARIVEKGVETGVANIGLDVASQGLRIADSRQEGFSPAQTAAAGALGAALGAGAHGLGEIASRRAARVPNPDDIASPARSAAEAQEPNYFDRFTPEDPAITSDIARTDAATSEIRSYSASDLREQYSTNGAVDHSLAGRGIAEEAAGALDEGRSVSATLDGSPREIVAAGDGVLVDAGGQRWNAAAVVSETPGAGPALKIEAKSGQTIAARLAPAIGDPSSARAAAGLSGKASAPRLEDIITRLKEAASENAAFRKGRMAPVAGGKKLGQFDTKQGVIRVADVADLPTITHEIAHDYETHFGAALASAKTTHSAELKPLAYEGAKVGSELSEGFAEFMRHYVTNPAYAQKQAPGFYRDFTRFIEKASPEKAAALADAQAGYREWLSAPSGAAITSDIVSEKAKGFVGNASTEVRRHGFRAAASMWLDKIYTQAFDRLHPLDMAVNKLLKIAEANSGQKLVIKAADNSYKLQRLAVDASQAGMVDLMHGVVPFKAVDPIGPSVFDALQLALGKRSFTKWDDEAVQEFGAYLVSRRALVEFERFERGEIPNPPGKFSKGDYDVAIRDFEAANPEWAQAAQMLYEFQNNMLAKKHAAGFLTDEQLETFLAKSDYVPFQRDMADFGEEVGTRTGSSIATARGKGKAGVVKAFRGSTRSVINPIETIMRDSIETANLIARNETFKSLDRLAELAGPGGGSIVERIPSHQMKGSKVDVTELIEAAAKQQGLDPRDIQQLRDVVDSTLGEHVTATIFRAGEINEKGEPIVFVWRNGRKQALRLADGEFGRMLHTTLTGMAKEQSNFLLDVLALPSMALRAGITTSPEFLFANYIRDQMSAWILSGEKFTPFISGAVGIGDELLGSNAARLYSQAGGISGGANTAAVHSARIDHDIQALRKKGFAVERLTSVEGLLKVTELSETGTRLGVFKAGYKRGLKEGLSPHEALVEAAYTARDYIDFGRHGSRMIWARKLIPFFNAALQGLDKSARTMVAPFVKYRLGQPLTAAEKRELGTAAKAWAKVVIGLGGAGLAQSIIYRNDPEYEEISDYLRSTHWAVKLPAGKWLMIPKPFELAIPSNIIERAFEGLYRNDPKAWDRMAKGIAQVTVPPSSVPGVDIAYELASNYDFFRDRSIVPEELRGLEPALQFNAWTSEFGRTVGEALGVSPLYVDHAVTGFGGSWGRQILNWSNSLMRENAATEGLDDSFITKRFIKDVARGSTSSTRFWGLISRSGGEWERVAQTFKEIRDNPTLGNAEDYLAGKPTGQVAYAILNAEFEAKDKRLHPLRRARDAVTTISKFRQEMSLDTVATISDADPIVMAPAVKGQVDDVLSRLQMIEARNALISSKVPGWAQKQIMDTGPVWAELRAASPSAFEEVEARYAKAKVYTEEGVRKAWPEAEKRILQDRGEAFLGDLTTDARY